MCCFSQAVRSVSETRIFARVGEHGKQVIAYSMRLDAPQDLAMILPIPVKPKSAENAVEFVNLQFYTILFDRLELGFPPPPSRAAAGGENDPFSGAGGTPTLEVQKVGSFDASFVPTMVDFARLDRRFRLSEGTWDKLPQYADWGFVVFKLRKGQAQVHPMAFAFPTRDTNRLFFPTVHIHDGQIHAKAKFDHTLYCQTPRPGADLRMWEESRSPASGFVTIPFTKGVVRAELHVLRQKMNGVLKNEDVFLPLAAA